jgi:hypothetical protein
MGLLDDAIREHLDLKRRRGADPDEIERLEREALGPVRQPQPDSFEAPSPDEPRPAFVYQEDEPTGDRPEAPREPSFTDHGAALTKDEEEFQDWDAPERAPIQRDARGPIEGAIDGEPEAPAPGTPARPSPAEEPPRSGSIDEQHYLEQETVEHDVEREELAHPEDDDMLEETPDFLQDTPDHDRLWFEQRPPRDFDLDG